MVRAGMSAWAVGTGCDNLPHVLPCSCQETATPISASPAITTATLLLSRCLLKMVKRNIIVPEDILSFCCNGLQVSPVPCN